MRYSGSISYEEATKKLYSEEVPYNGRMLLNVPFAVIDYLLNQKLWWVDTEQVGLYKVIIVNITGINFVEGANILLKQY